MSFYIRVRVVFKLDIDVLQAILNEFEKNSNYLSMSVEYEHSIYHSYEGMRSFEILRHELRNHEYAASKLYFDIRNKKYLNIYPKGVVLDFFEAKNSIIDYIDEKKDDRDKMLFSVDIYCRTSFDDDSRRLADVEFYQKIFKKIANLNDFPSAEIVQTDEVDFVKAVKFTLIIAANSYSWHALIEFNQVFYLNLQYAILEHGKFQVKGFHVGIEKLMQMLNSKTPLEWATDINIVLDGLYYYNRFTPNYDYGFSQERLKNTTFQGLMTRYILTLIPKELKTLNIISRDLKQRNIKKYREATTYKEMHNLTRELRMHDNVFDEELSFSQWLKKNEFKPNDLYLDPGTIPLLRTSMRGQDFKFSYSLMSRDLNERIQKAYTTKAEFDILENQYKGSIPLPPPLVDNIRRYLYQNSYDPSLTYFLYRGKYLISEKDSDLWPLLEEGKDPLKIFLNN